MKRTQNKMACKRRFNGDLSRFKVSDLSDEDNIGVLPKKRTQRSGKSQPDLRMNIDLINAF